MAIFTAASEAFNRKNLNCSVEESLRKFDDMVAAAKAEGVAVRGYVSCVVGCPYQVGFVLRVVRGTSGRWWQWPGRWAPVAHMRGQPDASCPGYSPAPAIATAAAPTTPLQGEVLPKDAARVAGALHEMGCYEVSMGDTIGVGTPASGACMLHLASSDGRWPAVSAAAGGGVSAAFGGTCITPLYEKAASLPLRRHRHIHLSSHSGGHV